MNRLVHARIGLAHLFPAVLKRWSVLLLAVIVVVFLLHLFIPPFDWLPPAGEASDLLGNLLAAQAALVALMLAISLFLLQGVRQNTDERMYLEYVRLLGIRLAFYTSLIMLALTGAAAVMTEYLIAESPEFRVVPGLADPVRMAIIAFVANMLLGSLLFEQAHRLTDPVRQREVKANKNQRDIRNATSAFLARKQSPDPQMMWIIEDRSAIAVRALLEDARRAMDENRQGDFECALMFIQDLVTDAMDAIEQHGISWMDPGSRPEWPPLRDLSNHLDPFRKAVITNGRDEYMIGLLGLDYWFLSNGFRRRCGELFTVGVDASFDNYLITSGDGSKSRQWLAYRAWTHMLGLFNTPDECRPYLTYALQHQERMLSHALDNGYSNDFVEISTAVASLLGQMFRQWGAGEYPRLGTEYYKRIESGDPMLQAMALRGRLEQLHRIGLMGLAGRAIRLAAAGRIASWTPYVEMARSVSIYTDRLVDDLVTALDYEFQDMLLWRQWEGEGPDYEVIVMREMDPQRYPLTYFGVRLLELANGTLPELHFRGKAEQVLKWFERNSDLVEGYVQSEPTVGIDVRRKRVLDALQQAVLLDERVRDMPR